MDPDSINAISAGLSAIAAVIAAAIGALSIVQLRRSEARGRRREANERDESLQMRLEALYPAMYGLFGAPTDTIPTEVRPTAISFFGLYADTFTALEEGLLPPGSAETFLEEFDWWVCSENAREIWGELRRQSWPEGFSAHVDSVIAQSRGYSSLQNNRARYLISKNAPGLIEIRRNPDSALLRTASWTLASLRAAGYAELPPASLDAQFSGTREEPNRLTAQLTTYADWLEGSDTAVWGRWTAVLDGRAVGHVCVCEPHPYLSGIDLGEDSEGRILEVSRLFTDPRVQGLGIGSALLDCAEELIKRLGHIPALAVLQESTDAIRMYEKRGWTCVGHFDGVQGHNSLMVLLT